MLKVPANLTFSAIYWIIIVSNKPALIGDYAFSQMEFVCLMTQAKFGGSVGIMSAARPKFQIMERDFSEGK